MIQEDLTAGIVQILSYDGIVAGTGFLVSENMVVTCAHVIESADPGPDNKVTVRFPLNGKEINAIILPERWRSPDQEDLSILQLEDNIPENAKVLSLGASAGVISHKVCAFGFPDVGEVEGIWSRGEVSGKVTERGISLLQINSNEITEGFSGAPLWDESRHRVIGIVVCIAETDTHGKLQNIAFATPSETLISICPELKIEDICPYRGLFSFKEDDEFLFFGRSKLVEELAEQLRTNPRFLALVGSSGSGKSSLVFAGLLPRIKRSEIVGFENAHVATFRPNDVSKSDGTYESDPEESLRQALKKAGINIEKADLWEGIRLFLETKPYIRLVLYGDQFEILFANPNKAKQIKFIEGMNGLLKSELKISLLLTIRGDYYDLLLNSLFGDYLSEGQANIRSMSAEEFREAIRKPAEVTGLEIETGLEDLIIKDLKDTKNPLPLLEFTLTQLWTSKSDGMLTHDNYLKIGGASGAIGQWANETYNGLNAEEKELSRKIFTRLVHYGERDMPDSRRRLSLEKLAGDCDETIIRQLVKKLADAHILVTDSGSGKGSETVEIIHDSLLIEWKQLNKWITEHRGFLTWRQRLEDKMEEWNNKNDESNLLRGVALAEAKGWMKNHKDEFNPQEIGFINASTELEGKEWAEKERSRSRIVKGLTAFSIIILSLAIFSTYLWINADHERQNAENQTHIAEIQKQIADNKSKEALAFYLNSQSHLLQSDDLNIDKSILLAIESFRIYNTYTADQLIRHGLSLIPSHVVILNHSKNVTDVEFSPDGKYLATASDDNTARIWNVSTGEEIVVMNHSQKVTDLEFSPDGKYIATASDDKTARIWDAYSGKRIAIMKHDGGINDVAFGPDGKYIATASIDGTANVWNAFTGEKITTLNHIRSVNKVAFSPDGKYVATASDDNTANVWNAFTGEKITTLNHKGGVKDIVFSPDGKYVATASWDKTAGVWNISTGKEIATMNHNDCVNYVAFSLDGKFIATASSDYMAGVWDIATGKEIAVLKHKYTVNKVAFSPDGKYVATASDDYTGNLWDAYTGKEIFVMNHNAEVNDVVFSPDGKYVSTASFDKTACIWDISAGEEPLVLKHNSSVRKVTFSPDGKYIATASYDKTAIVWNASSGEKIAVINHDYGVNDVAFSPDGKYVATSCEHGAPCIWDTNTGGKIVTLGNSSGTRGVTFSPDGKYIATVNCDNTASIWDAFTGERIAVLKHDDEITDIEFSPDGKHVATASKDKTARYWDAFTGEEISVLRHDGEVKDIVFSPDGKYIATASRDNTAGIWDADTGKEITVLKHNDVVQCVAFSSDGEYVLTGSWDGTACIWNASTGEKISVLKHDYSVSQALFSPDGKYVVTSNYGNTASIWNTTTCEKISILQHDSLVNDIVFSPDGKRLATSSNDNTAKLWVSSTEELINESSHRLTRNLTPQEWTTYMGNEPYHKTFPNLP